MEATEAIKIGNVYVSKEDIVHIVCTVDNTPHDIIGRVCKLNSEWMFIDDSMQYRASNFQAWRKSITNIELLTPEVMQ